MLISNGDCLLATVMARQIKQDFPGCHLTWAISDLCRQAIENNPYVDAIWERIITSRESALNEDWYSLKSAALEKKNAGEFDEVFFTQVYPDNVHNYDGTTRGTIYKAYHHKITVDARPVLRLVPGEIESVARFAAENNLRDYVHVLLFECSSLSKQSFVTAEWALIVAKSLVELFPDMIIILSTHEELSSPHQRVIIGNKLSLRENAELTKYCSLFVGCSSGITWMATSDWAKRLPMIQFLKRAIGFSFASVVYDHEYWGLDASQIIETSKKDPVEAVAIISYVLQNGVGPGRFKFHRQLKPRFLSMIKYSFMFFRKGKFGRSFRIASRFIARNYLHRNRSRVKS